MRSRYNREIYQDRADHAGYILLGRVTGVNWTFYVWTGVLVGFFQQTAWRMEQQPQAHRSCNRSARL